MINNLQLLAKEFADMAADSPPLESLAALLEVGQLAEVDPDAAGFVLSELSVAATQTLLAWTLAERKEDVSYLHRQLVSVEAHLDLLVLPAVLADDPEAAEAAQGQALAALHTRERIHRLGVAATWLRAEGDAEDGLAADIAPLDEQLRAVVAQLAVLAPERARVAAEVAPQEQAAHWWWTEPCHVDAQAETSPEDSVAVAQLQQWVAQRVVVESGDRRLQLSEDESSALLSTLQGQRLAAFLGDRLEFTAPQAGHATYAGTVGELLEGRGAPSRHSRPSDGKLVELWLQPRVSRPERLAAATASDPPVLRGLDAVAGVYCTAAELVPGIGVVAHGTRAFDGSRQRVWLFVPETGVSSLSLTGAGEPCKAAQWSPGGLAFALDDLDEPLHVLTRRDESDESPGIHQDLEIGPAQIQPNLLTRLLRQVYEEQLQAVRTDWAELVKGAGADDLQALSGLRVALTALFGENWP